MPSSLQDPKTTSSHRCPLGKIDGPGRWNKTNANQCNLFSNQTHRKRTPVLPSAQCYLAVSAFKGLSPLYIEQGSAGIFNCQDRRFFQCGWSCVASKQCHVNSLLHNLLKPSVGTYKNALDCESIASKDSSQHNSRNHNSGSSRCSFLETQQSCLCWPAKLKHRSGCSQDTAAIIYHQYRQYPSRSWSPESTFWSVSGQVGR